MNIIYELNPPKILLTNQMELKVFNSEKDKFLQRATIVSNLTNGIHLTDSVLGIPRLSSICAAQLISYNTKNPDLNISCSIRTRDRNLNSIIQTVADSIVSNVKRLLFILGDKPSYNSNNIDSIIEKPTDVVMALNNLGFNRLTNILLSVPNKITNVQSLQKKIAAQPMGFITQSVSSISEVRILKELLNPHKLDLIPCIMVPSPKNQRAATMIGLDWSGYKDNFIEFIEQIDAEGIKEILLTSPNNFDEGVQVLKGIMK